MAREICNTCRYPEKTCLCDSIARVTHKTKVLILQHPSEMNNAKNTVKLLSLLSNNIEIRIGENERDFEHIKTLTESTPESYLVLFPTESANNWNEWQRNFQTNNIDTTHITLIVIDGTWKKAKKIFYLNSWLQKLNALKIENIDSIYAIRKTSISDSLSTLEAVAAALHDIENTRLEPFTMALNGLNRSFTKLMPTAVKQRYKNIP